MNDGENKEGTNNSSQKNTVSKKAESDYPKTCTRCHGRGFDPYYMGDCCRCGGTGKINYPDSQFVPYPFVDWKKEVTNIKCYLLLTLLNKHNFKIIQHIRLKKTLLFMRVFSVVKIERSNLNKKPTLSMSRFWFENISVFTIFTLSYTGFSFKILMETT